MNAEKIKVNNSMLIPIKNNDDRVIAVLEVSNVANDIFGYD